MDEHDVMKRQIKKPGRAEEATERLAGLHRPEAKLQSSPGMEMLEKIAADAVLHVERVSGVVAGYRKTAHTEATNNDPLTAYVQRMLAHAEIRKRSGNALLAPHKKEAAGLRLLNVNHFILGVGADAAENGQKKGEASSRAGGSRCAGHGGLGEDEPGLC